MIDGRSSFVGVEQVITEFPWEGCILSPTTTGSAVTAPIKLGVRKGSIVAPLALLLLTILLFIMYALPSGFDQLGAGLGLTHSPDQPLTLEIVAKALETDASRAKIWATISGFSAWEIADKIARPLFKVYLDQLVSDFGVIVRSFATTVLQIGLYSLIPGVAGLIYRRNFGLWFAASFATLLAINASGLFGSLTSAQPMKLSGTIFFFIVTQIIVLVLAYRLRRHAKGLGVMPARLQNWLLTAILVFVGVACWQGWGPGYNAGASGETKVVAPAQPATSPSAPQDAAPAAATAVPAQSTQGAPMQHEARQRSWIWSFLGTGLTGWIYKWEFMLLGLPVLYTLLRNSAAWTAQRPKNIVICLDGTSNTPDQMEMGFMAQTNVFKLFRALKGDKQGMFTPAGQFDASLCKKYGEKQIGLYYAGVGNKYDNDPILQTLGLATGKGAADIVERAYLDLVRVYHPGDRIFIFGFSRGAAISRLLARTIEARGAPRAVWTLRVFGKHRTLWSSARKQPMVIDVLGCWDTVGSFGVAKTIAGINLQQLNLFKDLTVPDNVAQAYHVVALDEQRAEFEPTLMDPDPIRPERIVEVWFSGDHANIGGGWATDKLSDITLDFLLRRISSGYATDAKSVPGDERWGIYLEAIKTDKLDVSDGTSSTGVLMVDPDPLGQVRSWFSNLYNYRPRRLPLHAVISETVFERMRTSTPVYAPQSLFDLNDALDVKRDLIEAKVGKLGETQSLDDDERKAILEFKDKLRLTRWPHYWENLEKTRAPRARELVLVNDNPGETAKVA